MSEQTKLTERQQQVLTAVKENPGLNGLALSIRVDGHNPGRGANMTLTLKALERRGLIRREQSRWNPIDGQPDE